MPVDEGYRKQAQGKAQDLIPGSHEKPALKLAVEAVVEGIKLYRSYKEKKAAEEKKERGRENHKIHRRDRHMG